MIVMEGITVKYTIERIFSRLLLMVGSVVCALPFCTCVHLFTFCSHCVWGDLVASVDSRQLVNACTCCVRVSIACVFTYEAFAVRLLFDHSFVRLLWECF